jgi:hypothetical protein
LRAKRQLTEALDVFKRAHALAPSARTLAQMGLTEGNLRRWVDAEGHLEAALNAHDTPWIENANNHAAIKDALAVVRGHIGLVSITGPAGADITIGGVLVGRLPLPAPVHVPEGPARVEASATGRQSAAVDLQVPGGHELTVHLDLPSVALPTAQEQPVRSSPAPILTTAQTPVAESTAWKTWTGGGLLAASAALVATGIVWIAIDDNGTCSAPAGTRCMNVYNTQTQGLIATGAGVAAGIVGGILLWQGVHSDTRVSLGLGGVNASGTF